MTTPTAAAAAAAFSPAEEKFPLPKEAQSDRFRKALAEAGSNSEFRRSIVPLRTLGIYTSFKTVERVSEREGGNVAHDRHGPFARVEAAKEAPPNPPALMVLQADGMRVRLTEDETDEAPQAAGSGCGWHECKVGSSRAA